MSDAKIYSSHGYELLRVSYEELKSRPEVYGVPVYYAIHDNEIYLWPEEEQLKESKYEQ